MSEKTPYSVSPPSGPTCVPQQQNSVNLQAAVSGMTAEGNTIVRSVQAYNTHQQQLNAELSRCANYDVAQI